MIRGLILALTLFVAGCQSVPTYHRFENPREVEQVSKGQEIEIVTVDNKRIVMKYDSVTEIAIIGYVVEVYSGRNSYVVELADGDEVIDSILFENIDAIIARGTRYKAHSAWGEIFAPPTAEDFKQGVGDILGCIISFGHACRN